MDVVTSVVATGITVTVGQWAKEKQLTMKVFVGMGALAVFLTVLQQSNVKLAQQFAALILVTAVLIYGVDIGKKLGGLR